MPTAWTLSLVYTGGGLDAPGGIMFDREGAVWTSNNFTAGSQSFLQQRGFPGLGATKLAPDGKPLSGPFGFEGAGVLGAGYGIAIDQRGHVWIGNFAGNSLSELRPDGTPGSPTAYTAGGTMAGVQGVAVDQQGNVWAANDVSKNVTLHRPSTGQTQSFANDPGMVGPWGINVDGDDNVWVADFWGQRLSNLCGVAGRCPPGVTLAARSHRRPAMARTAGCSTSRTSAWISRATSGPRTTTTTSRCATCRRRRTRRRRSRSSVDRWRAAATASSWCSASRRRSRIL